MIGCTRFVVFLVLGSATALGFAHLFPQSADSSARFVRNNNPTLEARLARQRDIDAVLWRHRLWPSENPLPKPPLGAVLSETDIRRKVEATFRRTNVLAALGRPISGPDLQAEIDRLAADTKDPTLLGELFAALDNDPRLIAECLARPLVADRRFREIGGWNRDTGKVDSLGLEIDAPDFEYRLPEIARTGGRSEPPAPPAARSEHTAVWTGVEMIVWGGGFGHETYLNSGGCYVPALDVWTPTSTDDAPSPRAGHSAVWTGAEMIVWGGGSGFEFRFTLKTGGRYNPTADSWTPTSTKNVPNRREKHVIAWTGTHMLVWGGSYAYDENYRVFRTSGGRYDPVEDRWEPMSTAKAPEAEYARGGVWTGTRLLVWGGYEPYEDEDEDRSSHEEEYAGGVYDPETDSWSPMSTAGQPSPRNQASLVWTGRELLVWGGYDATYPDAGGRYDPNSDTWKPLGLVNAPLGRYLHTVVWTGREMIVWGGTRRTAVFNTGGRYDPETDTWTPVSASGAPVPRLLHTAVWTGREMFVWGGYGGRSLNDGARYDPATDEWKPVSLED